MAKGSRQRNRKNTNFSDNFPDLVHEVVQKVSVKSACCVHYSISKTLTWQKAAENFVKADRIGATTTFAAFIFKCFTGCRAHDDVLMIYLKPHLSPRFDQHTD